MRKINRRHLLRLTLGLGGAIISPRGWSRLSYAGATSNGLPPPVIEGPYVFLSAIEVAFIDAAVERLIPTDASGPGAAHAGVTLFIDRQLSGPYGQATRWYMQGPWQKGTDAQGYQLQQSPAQLYPAAIAAINTHCRQAYRGKDFYLLGASDQDSVLHALETGDVELPDAPGKTFFTMLWQNTKEGFFADPIYGGNRGFIGWKLVGFPGPRYNYIREIGQYGQAYPLPTVGLAGRDPSRMLEGGI